MLLLLIALAAALAAQNPAPAGSSREVLKTPLPAWVEDHPVDMSRPAPRSDVGSTWTLLDDWQYDSRSKTTFWRLAYRFMSETGVQEESQLNLGFDPTYQRLRVHRLIIHRDGKALDRLPGQTFRIIERESRHERQLYDRRLSALLVIEDVRVGDTLEYAFSREGANPVVEGHYATRLSTNYSVPLAHLRMRLLWHEPRPLEIKNFRTTLAPEIRKKDGLTEYAWAADDVPALFSDGDTPPAFSPWGAIRITDWPSWAAVAAWAEKQYVIPKTLPDRLEALVDRIEGCRTDHDRVEAALGWIQDKYRYVGMVEGVHSYRPHDIATICKRGFGDCKDKALLLTAVLRRLGYPACPALVNTYRRGAIADWPPSPQAFNHVIVQVVVDEEVFWIDPTRSYQRGELRDLFLPDYRYALVLRSGETALTALNIRPDLPCGTFITETFSLKDFAGDATLRVKTRYAGRNADQARASLADENREAIEKRYLSHYARLYPKIEMVDSIEVRDDVNRNQVTIREAYRIKEVWEPRPDHPDQLQLTLGADSVSGELTTPGAKVRTMPFAVRHPVCMDQTIEVRFPIDMNLTGSETRVTNPAFRFRRIEEARGKRHVLRHHYRSLRDTVEAADAPRFIRDVARADAATGMCIWVPKSYRDHLPTQVEAVPASGPIRLNGMVVVITLVTLALAMAAAFCLARWKPSYTAPNLPPKTPRGISGWLILPAIGVVLSPLISLIGLLSMLVENTSFPVWDAMTSPDSAGYHPLWQPVLLAETACLAALLVLDVLLLILFFRKWYTVPRLYITWLALNCAYCAAFYLFYKAIPNLNPEVLQDYAKDAVRGAVGLTIWGSYFGVSKRVKATFVEGVPKPLAVVGATADTKPGAEA